MWWRATLLPQGRWRLADHPCACLGAVRPRRRHRRASSPRPLPPRPDGPTTSNERLTTMKLYLAPGSCRLADTRPAETRPSCSIAPGSISGQRPRTAATSTRSIPRATCRCWSSTMAELLTENVAILAWAAERAPSARAGGRPLGRVRLSRCWPSSRPSCTRPSCASSSRAAMPRKQAAETHPRQSARLSREPGSGNYLFAAASPSPTPTCYVMLPGAREEARGTRPAVGLLRLAARPAVQLALQHEGLA